MICIDHLCSIKIIYALYRSCMIYTEEILLNMKKRYLERKMCSKCAEQEHLFENEDMQHKMRKTYFHVKHNNAICLKWKLLLKRIGAGLVSV